MNRPGFPTAIAYAIRPLRAEDSAQILRHLRALDADDRSARFGAAADDATLARYVESLDFTRDALLGAVAPDGSLLGLAHVALHGGVAELGLSVGGAHRQLGLAGVLSAAALRAARDADAREFRFHSVATNEGMRRIARRLGMAMASDGSEVTASRVLRRRPLQQWDGLALALD